MRTTLHAESPKDVSTVTQARIPAPRDSFSLWMAAPKTNRTTKPNRGRSRTIKGRATSTRSSKTPLMALPLQKVEGVHVEGVAPALQRDDDGEAHRRLGRGHGQHEEDEHLAVQGPPRPAERDEGQVHRVEHQLHAHEEGDDVAPQEDPERAQ